MNQPRCTEIKFLIERKKEGNIKREKERKKERHEAVFFVYILLGIYSQGVIKRKRFKVVFNLKL